MKNCVGVADLLCAYADNELEESNKHIVEAHLLICENCSTILKLYSEISTAVNETNVPAPEALRIGVMNRIQSESIPQEPDNKKQRRLYKYVFTRVAPVAACLAIGLLVWQFWGSLRGINNEDMYTAAPAPMAAAPAPEAAEEDSFRVQIDEAPEAQMEAAGVFGLENALDDTDAEAVPAPDGNIASLDNGETDFIEILYDRIDGFGPLAGAEVNLFREASVVITVVGDLPLALANAEPLPDWQYGRFGWEQLYVMSREMLASILDEVGGREGTVVVHNTNDIGNVTTGNYIIILLTYGL